MKNYVSAGNVLPFTAAADFLSGAVVIMGGLIGIAVYDVLTGAVGEAKLDGVYSLPKVGSQAWTVGALIYWDAANSRCTTSASGNTLMGRAWAPVGSGAGETTGIVRLNH